VLLLVAGQDGPSAFPCPEESRLVLVVRGRASEFHGQPTIERALLQLLNEFFSVEWLVHHELTIAEPSRCRNSASDRFTHRSRSGRQIDFKNMVMLMLKRDLETFAQTGRRPDDAKLCTVGKEDYPSFSGSVEVNRYEGCFCPVGSLGKCRCSHGWRSLGIRCGGCHRSSSPF